MVSCGFFKVVQVAVFIWMLSQEKRDGRRKLLGNCEAGDDL